MSSQPRPHGVRTWYIPAAAIAHITCDTYIHIRYLSFYTTGRVYAGQIFPVGVGVMLPILLL